MLKVELLGALQSRGCIKQRVFGYLGYQIPCPLMYMTGGELVRLIMTDNCWKHFSNFFLGDREIIKNKFDEIGSVRNALAHFRPIQQGECRLVKQNARHVLSRIEKCLIDMLRCSNVVPTNTQDDWYKGLRTLGTDFCTLYFNQSDDENWVKVTLRYSCPVLSERGGSKRKRFRGLTINSPALLQEFAELRKRLIYLLENVVRPSVKDEVTMFTKEVVMVFGRQTIAADHKVIQEQIKNILQEISEETGLLQDDNLARGKIVRGADASATWQEMEGRATGGYWLYDRKGLYSSISEDDPPEFWGGLGYVPDDYITDTEEYPWMPVIISESAPF